MHPDGEHGTLPLAAKARGVISAMTQTGDRAERSDVSGALDRDPSTTPFLPLPFPGPGGMPVPVP
jgi:hypothetical protein